MRYSRSQRFILDRFLEVEAVLYHIFLGIRHQRESFVRKITNATKRTTNPRVIILAGGGDDRWGNYKGKSRYFADVGGEALLMRTIRQLKEQEQEDIFVVSSDPDCGLLGVERYVPTENVADHRYLSSFPKWNEDGRETILLSGDTYFTDQALAAIVQVPSSGFTFFGRSARSELTGKARKEVFAIKFSSHLSVINAFQHSKTRWEAYELLTGHGVKLGEQDHFIELNDVTEDFDEPADLDKWLLLTGKARGVKEHEGKPIVMVCIPNLGSIQSMLAQRLIQWANHKKNWEALSFFMPSNQIPHDSARNYCVKQFLQSNATHLFFLDDDVVPPADALEKLLSADKDVISGIYPCMKVDERNPVMVKRDVVFRRQVDELGVEGLMHVTNGKGIEEIDAAGGGCLLIKRQVLETITAPWFKFHYDPDGVLAKGEDVDFFEKAKAAGFTPFADFTVKCGHHKKVML